MSQATVDELKSILTGLETSVENIKDDTKEIKGDFKEEKEETIKLRIHVARLEERIDERTRTLSLAIKRNFKQHDDFYETQDEMKKIQGLGLAVKIMIPILATVLIMVLKNTFLGG
jgi:regulator of replication initiation timing